MPLFQLLCNDIKLGCKFYEFYVARTVSEILVMMKKEVLLMFFIKGVMVIQAT